MRGVVLLICRLKNHAQKIITILKTMAAAMKVVT